MTDHATITIGDIHLIYNWSFDNATDRGNASVVAGDVGKVAHQEDNGTYWQLIDTGPTWAQVGNIEINFTINTQVSTTINIEMQAQWGGANVSQAYALYGWVSDTAGGDLAASPPTSGISIGTNGIILNELVSEKLFLLLFDSDGQADIDMVQSGADTFYLNFILPDGSISSSGAITFT